MIIDNIMKFDPSDCNTIRDTIDSIIQAGEMQYGRTEDGEPSQICRSLNLSYLEERYR